MDIHIIIPEVFNGTLDQWQDTMFAFPPNAELGARLQKIVEFCETLGWEIDIQFRLKRE